MTVCPGAMGPRKRTPALSSLTQSTSIGSRWPDGSSMGYALLRFDARHAFKSEPVLGIVDDVDAMAGAVRMQNRSDIHGMPGRTSRPVVARLPASVHQSLSASRSSTAGPRPRAMTCSRR
jgi:hypothetical protein